MMAYTENTGKQPNNLEKDHPAFKLWTYKNKRNGDVLGLIDAYNK